jgi:hypothetical protein
MYFYFNLFFQKTNTDMSLGKTIWFDEKTMLGIQLGKGANSGICNGVVRCAVNVTFRMDLGLFKQQIRCFVTKS